MDDVIIFLWSYYAIVASSVFIMFAVDGDVHVLVCLVLGIFSPAVIPLHILYRGFKITWDRCDVVRTRKSLRVRVVRDEKGRDVEQRRH